MLKLKKTMVTTVAALLCVSTFVGCSNNKDVQQNYSVGLDENGYYEDFDKHKFTMPDTSQIRPTDDEVIAWSLKNGDSENAIEDAVKEQAVGFLEDIGAANKEGAAEIGDKVLAALEFKLDGKVLEDYISSKEYVLTDTPKDSIEESILGKSLNDKYDVKYTFPENDDPQYAGKTADVTVTIAGVYVNDVLNDEYIQKHLDKIHNFYKDVTDLESLLVVMKKDVVQYNMPMFIEEKLQELEAVEVPKEYTEYEMSRLKMRLERLGIPYEEYLKGSKTTDEEQWELCERTARGNIIAMVYFKNLNDVVSKRDLQSMYLDEQQFNDMKATLGEPYMKEQFMKQYSFSQIANEIIENNQNPVSETESATTPTEKS